MKNSQWILSRKVCFILLKNKNFSQSLDEYYYLEFLDYIFPSYRFDMVANTSILENIALTEICAVYKVEDIGDLNRLATTLHLIHKLVNKDNMQAFLQDLKNDRN